MPPGYRHLWWRLSEQFELNVVRVAEDEYGSARYGVRRRDRGMDHRGVREPRRPGVEFPAVRDGEGQVIQAGASRRTRPGCRADAA